MRAIRASVSASMGRSEIIAACPRSAGQPHEPPRRARGAVVRLSERATVLPRHEPLRVREDEVRGVRPLQVLRESARGIGREGPSSRARKTAVNLERADFSECPAYEAGEQHAHRRHSRRSPDVARVLMDHAGQTPASGRAETTKRAGKTTGVATSGSAQSAFHGGPASDAMSASPRRGAFASRAALRHRLLR